MSVSVGRKQECISKTEPAQVTLKLQHWMDDCLKRINKLAATPSLSICHVIQASEVIAILRLADQIFLEEQSLLELTAPIKIIGDLSGQFQDLSHLFQLIGKVPEEKLLFLGNYVGIGLQGIECFVCVTAKTAGFLRPRPRRSRSPARRRKGQ